VRLALNPAVRFFAARVAKLSQGALRIQITFQAAGDKIAEVEQRTVRMVQAGRFDLGSVGSRTWDKLGVTSLEALQAPFLITSYPLLDRVVTSGIADRMLGGLRSQHVIGLALIPDQLRQPVGLDRALVSLSDFAGARVRIQPSRVTSSLMRALGATPVEVANAKVGSAIGHHRIDGEELSLGNAPSSGTVTGNVTFFAKAVTLFAGGPAYQRLTAQQRDVLMEAAKQTLEHVIATSPTESGLAEAFCRQSGARIVFASKSQLAALVRASQPVYAELERNAETRSFIAKIRRLRATTPAPPRLVVPPSCEREPQPAAATGKLRSPSILNGTYHLRFTIRDERRFGPPASNPENLHAGVETRILRDGHYRFAVGQPGGPDRTARTRSEATASPSSTLVPGHPVKCSCSRSTATTRSASSRCCQWTPETSGSPRGSPGSASGRHSQSPRSPKESARRRACRPPPYFRRGACRRVPRPDRPGLGGPCRQRHRRRRPRHR
jgi:TRAP-type C4-dicarboxylate transport system substrate-binding protein